MKQQFNEHLEALKYFVSLPQLEVLKAIFRGEEKEAAAEIAGRLAEVIKTMPGPYGSEETLLSDKIAYLHYFNSGSDWYIFERDEPGRQIQAFGYAKLDGMEEFAETGYISIEELILNRVELDFHFKPRKFSEI